MSASPPFAKPGRSAFMQTLSTSVGIQIATIVTGALIARALGPEGRGILAGAQIWPTILAGLSFLGINHALTLRAAQSGEYHRGLLSFALLASLALSALALVTGVIAIPAILREQPLVLQASLLFLPYIPIFVTYSMLFSLDQGRGHFAYYNASRGIMTATYVILVGVMFLAQVRNPLPYLLALLAANATSLMYRLSFLRRHDFGDPTPHWHIAFSGGAFFSATVVMLVRDQVERLFLFYQLNTTQLAYYVVAYSAAMMPGVIAKSLGLFVFSRTALTTTAQDAARLFRLLAIVNALVSAVSVVVLPPLLLALYGNAFSPATHLLPPLIVAQYFLAASSILDEGLRGSNRPHIGALACALMIAVFLAAAISLTPFLHAAGVAIAAASGHFAAFLLLFASFKLNCPAARLVPNAKDISDTMALGSQISATIMSRTRAMLNRHD